MRGLADERRRFGYRRLHVRLNQPMLLPFLYRTAVRHPRPRQRAATEPSLFSSCGGDAEDRAFRQHLGSTQDIARVTADLTPGDEGEGDGDDHGPGAA